MKKSFLILAVGSAILGFTSCSKDEKIAENNSINDANVINFRANANGLTRAADIINAADLKSFNVYAFKTGETTPAYFSNVPFTGPTTYNSEQKYYWPSYNLDFYAWSANSDANGDRTADVTATAYNSYTVTVQADADNQADFIYASKTNVAKTATVTELNFSHKESRITLSVKNTSANLRFDIVGWRIGFAAPSGSTTNGGTTWTPASAAATNVFTATEGKTANANSAASAFTKAQIMIPQTISPVTAYASDATDALVNNAYIAVKYKAQNTTNNEWVVGSSAADSEIWGIWPITAITWLPGKQYNYTLDIAEGGYYEKNTAAGSGSVLDPILGSYIKFASVIVTDWDQTSPAGDQSVLPMNP